MDHVLRLLHHLALRDPQGCPGHGDGKVVDLNAIKLSDGDLDGVFHIQHDLPLVEQGDHFVLKTPQGEVCLCQEIPGAAGRVQKFQAGQPSLKGPQSPIAGLKISHFRNFRELRPQSVQEQRVDDFVNIFNAGVVHAAGTPRLRVQGALKNGAEDGGADGRPVKVLTGTVEDQAYDLLVQPGDQCALVGKQTAVDIGEGRQVVIHVGIPIFRLRVQYLEEVDQSPAGVSNVALQIVMEHPAPAENPGVLGVQAEYQTDAEGVKAFQSLRALRVFVLPE